MVRRSRFLKQGSMPPSSSDRYSSSSYSRDYRATSAAPSRSYRSASAAPVRESSISRMRECSVAPLRASSRPPIRATSVAPLRASSLTPYYRSPVRASSVLPYSPSYTSTSSFSSRPFRASSLAPQSSSSFRSANTMPARAPASTKYRIDTSVPSRQFGTRLGVHKMETTVKPAIYDEYYGMTYVPSSGRDSWSAYRISDETLDDNDDLVYESAKKDHEVMKRVNKQIVQAMSVQPLVYVPVAPAYRRFTPSPIPKIIHAPRVAEINHANSVAYRRAPVPTPGTYRVPPPAVKVSYDTAYDGVELMRPKHKSIANEPLNVDRSATYTKLKERLREARDCMDRNKTSGSKYMDDPDLRAISTEVSAIKNARAIREQSLVPDFNQMMQDHKSTSDLRKRIRSTLRRSKCRDTSV